MDHVILLGDSILDNRAYVEPGPAVVEQLRSRLPNHNITLLAVDGSITTEVTDVQLPKLPTDATHLVISSGGNDALRAGMMLMQEPGDAFAMLERLTQIKAAFEEHYRQMLKMTLASQGQVILCTIYDRCPVLEPVMQQLAYAVLPMFNDCITRQAFAAGVPLLDLRLICDQAEDYAAVSPIEPSVQGGAKICDRIARLLGNHPFEAGQSVIYT